MISIFGFLEHADINAGVQEFQKTEKAMCILPEWSNSRRHIMKKLLILCMTFICILSGCGNTDSEQNTEQKSSYKQVSMEEGLELMKEDSGYILLDVRRTDEFEEGHIPGAINIPNESIGTEEIKELPDKNQTIYVYCRSGNRSKQASQKLVDLGYTDVIEFGGIIDYSGEIEKGRQ